ncbi:hypothetical protein NSTCB13_06230 [Nostoc sp. DSM 114160]|jgi:hypothetical protein
MPLTIQLVTQTNETGVKLTKKIYSLEVPDMKHQKHNPSPTPERG